jgi:hypothetical protein
LLPFGGFFIRGLPTLPFHGINSDSAGNYQLIDLESTVRMGFPPGITSSGTRNPPEEWDSAGNNQLKAVTISGSASTNLIYHDSNLFKKFKYENVIKMKNKPDAALSRSSYLFNEIKKSTPKSREMKIKHTLKGVFVFP